MSPARSVWTVTGGLLIAACGGGGGGGGGDGGAAGAAGALGPGDTSFVLESIASARPLFDVDEAFAGVVSPASLLERDPLTGAILEGYPKPLQEDVTLSVLATWNLAQLDDPITPQIPVVARNAALVLSFTRAVDVTSLALVEPAPDGPWTRGLLPADAPLRVERQDGTTPAVTALVKGARVVLVADAAPPHLWEPSPLLLDPLGQVVPGPDGTLHVVLESGLRATNGEPLSPLPSEAGGGGPYPFDPGNAGLDAVVLQTDDGTIGFNGFLPDLTAPRLVRRVRGEGTIGTILFATTELGEQHVDVVDPSFSPPPAPLANGGAGEWAGGVLAVTSTTGVTSVHPLAGTVEVAEGARFRLAAGETLDPSVQVGDAYTVVRIERYEPIAVNGSPSAHELLALSVDPEFAPRDPFDPQDALNDELRRFVRVFDEDGVERLDVWDPEAGVFSAIPPRSTLRVAFDEPMDVDSFRPYETFYVTEATPDATDPGFERCQIARVRAFDAGRTIELEPWAADADAPGGGRFLGFGGTPKSLRLVLRVRPEDDVVGDLLAAAPPGDLAQLTDLDTAGVGSPTSLGGRPLGLPDALFAPSSSAYLLGPLGPGPGAFAPAVDLTLPFTTAPSSDPEHGAIVHRFMGVPKTGTFVPTTTPADPVQAGIEYADLPPLDEDGDGEPERRFLYGPHLFDVGLGVSGVLTGHAPDVIEHVFDDFNTPAPSPLAPQGQDALLPVTSGVGVPLDSAFGGRMQHVYRAGDASPSYFEFNGTALDLIGLAWAPILGSVTDTTVPDIEILVGLSNVNGGLGPITQQSAGIACQTNSGLGQQFDCNRLEWGGFDPADTFAPTGPGAKCQQFESPKPTCEPVDLEAFDPPASPTTTVVQSGTPYPILAANLFSPSGGTGTPGVTFNPYLDFPAFNAGIDPWFGDPTVAAFPYLSRFPMLIEYRVRPPTGPQAAPPARNFLSVAPALLSSCLPRFRVWSQGQDPLARGVPMFNRACQAPGNNLFRAGEGGPLLEPGTQGAAAPVYVTEPSQQPAPDATLGDCATCTPPCGPGTGCPQPNSTQDRNFYFANGMLAYPLPSPVYGCGQTEPGVSASPADFGDNARYFMMFKYRKRVSRIESPTLRVDESAVAVTYLPPIVEPPLDAVPAGSRLRLEFRASPALDFDLPVESGWTPLEDVEAQLAGPTKGNVHVKFRAVFGAAPGTGTRPVIDTLVIPYRIE